MSFEDFDKSFGLFGAPTFGEGLVSGFVIGAIVLAVVVAGISFWGASASGVY